MDKKIILNLILGACLMIVLFGGLSAALNGYADGNLNLDLDSDSEVLGDINFVTDLDFEVNGGGDGLIVRTESQGVVETAVNPLEAVVIAQAYSESQCTNCEVELSVRDSSTSGEEMIVYKVKTDKRVELLGFIDSDMKVKTEINAETGEVIDVDKSWWFFLASETSAGYG